MIKVSVFIHNREKQSDPRLAWLMYQNIYLMYSDIKNKKESNSSILLTSMVEHEQDKKQNEKVEDSQNKAENNQPLLQNINIPSDINDIQPRATQVWNCDELGLHTNGRWNKAICS